MEISMDPYGTCKFMISPDNDHVRSVDATTDDWFSAVRRLLSRPSFRVIPSPYKLQVSDITEIKVFDGDRAMMVTIKTTDGEAEQVKAVCSSEDTFDLRKGVFIALAKYVTTDDSMTPEGYEFLAKCMTYYKDWSKLVDKAIRQYEKSCKEAEKKAKIQQKEKEMAAERRAKNFAKVQAKKKAKKDEFVQAVADAIRISSGKKEESSEKEEEKKYHTIKKARYEVGDRVLVKEWDDMASEYGIDEDGDIKTGASFFVKEMKKYCGKVMTVSFVMSDKVFQLGYNEWSFTNDMIEGAVQE